MGKYEVKMQNYCSGFTWVLDFCRAVNERNWFWKLLFRIAVGKYAWSEFKGLWNAVDKQGYDPNTEYGLETIDYHKGGSLMGPWKKQ